jgi:hypothetical protein
MSAANPNPMEKSMVSSPSCCKGRGGVAIAMWCVCDGSPSVVLVGSSRHRSVVEELLHKVVVVV